ncbi:MAG: NADH:flavin oxidoreductase, partial [Anaerolineae bacterium]
MSLLFEPAGIGNLELPNRLLRSATAERMADPDGRPRPEMKALWQELALGGVGMIISGHMFVHPSGKAHPEMTGIHSDEMIPALTKLTEAVHAAGGRVAVQINHGGMQCSRQTVSQTIAPSAIDAPFLSRQPRAMNVEEVQTIIQAYAAAARRAQEAGFDAVQIHGAHGYLISQFLSPFTNRRRDAWGGPTVEDRLAFLRAVCEATRHEVGHDYPLFIKLGMMDGIDGGLTPEDGAKIAAALEGMSLDAFEISGGISGQESLNTRSRIRSEEDEAYFRPLAQRARPRTSLPIALVGGFRSRGVMEDVLQSGDADFISLSRPLIREPGLPNRLRDGS